MSDTDNKFMLRAFQLAQKGMGSTSPNPMVGCVIVHQGKIIGEGWTQPYGNAHAEVHAISRVVNKDLLSESTAYVTLEPCAHFGKTPPCADLLIQHQLKRVVIANEDPFAKVNGKGIEKLRQAGIEFQPGLLSDIGEKINRRFFTFHRQKRPFIILKWAQSADGFIARENYDSKWISNAYSRKLVHKWRMEEAAILVGTNTAQYDDPMLNVRDWKGKNPLRIVIDKQLRLSKTLNLFDGSQPTICYNLTLNIKQHNLEYIKLDHADFIKSLLQDLYHRNILSLIIEGGSALINSFIEKELWDEARIFTSEVKFEKGIKAPALDFQKGHRKDMHGDGLYILRK